MKKPKGICAVIKGEPKPYLDQLIERISNLFKLKRIVAWLLVLQEKLLKRRTVCNITCSLLEKAEHVLVRHVQKKLDVKANQSLAPYIDDEGLVRVGGRLKHLGTIAANPVLLPKCHLSKLKVTDEHVHTGHMGTEYVLANLRSKGKWIPRRWVKSVIHDCFLCKRHFAKHMDQKKWLICLKRGSSQVHHLPIRV